MPSRGELKPPTMALPHVHAKAMDLINEYEEGCAIFLVGGRVHATRRRSLSFEQNLKRLQGGLVGVYDWAVDSRDVLDDLREFYKTRGAS